MKDLPIGIAEFTREIKVYDPKGCVAVYVETQSLSRYQSKDISHRTWLNHNSVKKLMREFNEIWPFKLVNAEWMKKFRRFLATKQFRPGQYYKPGQIWTTIKTVKAYLQIAAKDPMRQVDPGAINFHNPEPPVDTTFLNNEEVRRLMILHGNGGLTDLQQNVLSAFLYTCFTSLRISDVYRVNAKWQIVDDQLSFIPAKNAKRGKRLIIEIMPIAKFYIQQVTGPYFHLPAHSIYNKCLKDIAVKAEISKKLSSHVGRHTFGFLYMTTNGNLKGLQEILGHSKSSTTDRCAHLDSEYQRAAVRKIQDQFSDLIIRKVK